MNSAFNRTNSIKAGLFLFTAIAAASLAASLREPREPEYEGQSLSYYLRSLTYSQVRLERSARDAIRAMGSNALPHLIEILDARESRFKIWFNEVADRQSFIRFRFAPLEARQVQAAMACQELGPIAAPAIPALARRVDHPQLGHLAVAALAEIGPQTFPLLTNALASRWPSVRFAAVGHLRLVRPRERALPPLFAALRSEESHMRTLAAESLGALGLPSADVICALTASLDDPDDSVRVNAAQSLGWCGESAAGSFSKVLDLYRCHEGSPVQKRIAEALAAIDPAAAQRAGILK